MSGKTIKTSINLTTVLLCVLLITEYIFRMTHASRIIEWGIISILAIITYITERYDKYSFLFLLYLLCYSCLTIFSILLNGNGDLSNIASAFVYYPFVFLIFREKLNHSIVKKVFYFSNAVLILLLIIFREHAIIFQTARNSISALGIASYFLWLISAIENHEENKLLPTIVVFIVAFLGVGRAGILSATFLLLMNIFFYKSSKRANLAQLKKYIRILVILLILIVISYSLFMPALTNFQSRKFNSLRTDFWEEYFDKVIASPVNLLVGAPIDENRNMVPNGYWQLHNSFLGLHAKSGLVAFLTVNILLINSTVYLFKKKQLALLFFLIAFVFRTSLDYMLFNSPFDFIIYFYMFLPFSSSKIDKLKSGNKS